MAQLPQALQGNPVGRTRLSREELDRRQRDRILSSAIEIFAKRGYQASTVDNIVAAAGIGVGSFYSHFDGKEDCLFHVCRKISREVHQSIAAGTVDSESWAEALCGGLRELLRFCADKPLAARVVLLEAQTGGAKVLGDYAAMIDEIASFLELGRGSASPGPELPASFEEATASGLVWLLQERLVRSELKDVDGLFAELAEIALDPYLGTAAARREVKAAISNRR